MMQRNKFLVLLSTVPLLGLTIKSAIPQSFDNKINSIIVYYKNDSYYYEHEDTDFVFKTIIDNSHHVHKVKSNEAYKITPQSSLQNIYVDAGLIVLYKNEKYLCAFNSNQMETFALWYIREHADKFTGMNLT